MKRFAAWFFSEPEFPSSWRKVIAWWEVRRISFNVVIGAYGLLCLAVFLWAIVGSGHLGPGEDAVEPIALLAGPFAVNALYSLGWFAEVIARALVPDLSPRFGPTLLKLGLGLGFFFISVPPVYWVGYRALQLLGVVR